METPVENFKRFFKNEKSANLSRMDDLYREDVVFRDPVHQIRGLTSLQDYMADMYANITECRFEYLDELVSDGRAYIKWNMHFRHPKMGGKLITVRGVTHIHFDERIFFHEDIYDMGELLYEHVPIIGGATRWLKNRLVHQKSA